VIATQKHSSKKAVNKGVTKRPSKKVENKTKPTTQNVSAFINAVENETRRRDAKVILALMKKLTGDKPKMWGPSIIGFGEHHYKYESGREGDSLNVGFSPRKASMVLYVLGSLSDVDPLLAKLGKYKRGRACLYVNKLEDVDLKVLEKIITKSYMATKKNWAA